ncbi:T6SS effector amidase Tae4 family protein [Jiella pacifica]|uniref:Type VI secretion system (T6SS), amidase effector protein 4 n=1 Tax=Jiella pacifica TaxID=2696469 RepID=A0A6N9SWH2_9HYPH|nr:T6SS effector amidase Tae4 family protein [Jiella pacifica]NDW03364.1 hypothetical protein [Jiella pacifica]
MRPSFMGVWNAFPDHVAHPTLKDLYTWLGGKARQNIEAPGFGPNGNACASRLSVAFNNGGMPINPSVAASLGIQTITTGDGAKIIFRVQSFRKYLIKVFGDPIVDVTLPFNDKFLGQMGIIAFNVNWADASGHIALWNGNKFREPTHDDYSTYVGGTRGDVKTRSGEFWKWGS